MFFVFAFTYGNALNVQKEYVEFRTEEIVDSLKQVDAFGDDEIKYIKVLNKNWFIYSCIQFNICKAVL